MDMSKSDPPSSPPTSASELSRDELLKLTIQLQEKLAEKELEIQRLTQLNAQLTSSQQMSAKAAGDSVFAFDFGASQAPSKTTGDDQVDPSLFTFDFSDASPFGRSGSGWSDSQAPSGTASFDYQPYSSSGYSSSGVSDVSSSGQVTQPQPAVAPQSEPRFKCLLVGDGGIGKTCWMKLLESGPGGFVEQYNATVGVTVNPVHFNTQCGPICFNIWDTAGQERFGGLRDGYYIKADCAIVAFDVTRRSSFEHVRSWLRDLYRVCENIPCVLLGLKRDLEKEVKVAKSEAEAFIKSIPDPGSITSGHSGTEKIIKPSAYVEASAKTNFHVPDAVLTLARGLTGLQTLEFIPLLAPPSVLPQANALQAAVHAASQVTLPDEDDDW